MLALFSEVGNIINNRPSTYFSEDHEDMTPNHFLIKRNFCNICLVNDICNKNVCNRKKWRQVQKEQIHINDLVLIKEDNVKRGQWPLGRVVEVHPGEDGVVRVVTVKTSKGTYKGLQ